MEDFKIYRDSWIEIDLSAYKDNVRKLKKCSEKKFIAVIKANGYGCDELVAAHAALKAGADMLAVSSLDEALSLRKSIVTNPILILGYVNPCFASLLKEHRLIASTISLDWVKDFVLEDVEGCKVHLKIDTGMNRLGIKHMDEINEALSLLQKNGVEVEGIFTHFACSDEADNKHTTQQYDAFASVLNQIDINFKWIHCSNSDATIHFDDKISNATRCGIAMLGISSYKSDLSLVMSLKSKVISVKNIKKGECVSYGYHHQADVDETIAVIPLGYADGFSRSNEGRMVYLNGEYCEIVGRICMDQCMIKVSNDVKVGDVVEIFGEHIGIVDVARENNTIPYEIMTSLTDRLVKKIIEDKQVTKVVYGRFK